MRQATIGTVLLILGLLVGVATVVGLALGLAPALSPFMLKVVVYKLCFAAALGLLLVGAFVRRGARRRGRAGTPAA